MFPSVTGDRPTSTFSATLARLRRGAGLSQSQLAEKAGVPLNSLKSYEAGRRASPTWAAVLRLAGALGVSTDVFAGTGEG